MDLTKKTSKMLAIEKLKICNYVMVDDSLFENTNTAMYIRCLLHNKEFYTTVGNAYRGGKSCSDCPFVSWYEIANKKNYKIISEDKNNYATFQCEFNHKPWSTARNNIKFTNCKECSGKMITLQMVLDKIKTKGYMLLTESEYKNTKLVGKFKCNNEHIWETEIHNVYGDKSECPMCSTGNDETRCKFILETIFNKKFIKTRKIVEGGLELDMYNEELNLALEYNGIQHYKEDTKFFHKNGGFKEQQDRDNIKLNFCNDNNINLLIVPYTVKGNDIITFIISELKGLKCNLNIDWEYVNSIN